MRQHGGRYCKREHDVGRDFRQTTGLVGGGKQIFLFSKNKRRSLLHWMESCIFPTREGLIWCVYKVLVLRLYSALVRRCGLLCCF